VSTDNNAQVIVDAALRGAKPHPLDDEGRRGAGRGRGSSPRRVMDVHLTDAECHTLAHVETWVVKHNLNGQWRRDLTVEAAQAVERIIEARLAPVEALADEWATWPNTHDANGPQDYAKALRAALEQGAEQ